MVRSFSFEVDLVKEQHKNILGSNVYGKTLGVIGLGSIGDRVGQLGNALGMKVIAYNRSPRKVDNIEMVSVNDLLVRSDIVTIHLALTPETEYFIDEQQLALMKPTAIIINTARGKHIKTAALYEALKNKKIAGAGLDALAELHSSNQLLKLDNVVFMPHAAFFTAESLENMSDTIVENITCFIKGNSKNIVI
jgi:lactate dehydrogenase-like 2-hydroxyacid dehydrogenase